ncbi:MAG TPA: lytic transglycosylase domain-containing protein [Trueperaceae bacterium]|nr:lytic transglycosylase domain-containing protein [Trueperaceae bacterium]
MSFRTATLLTLATTVVVLGLLVGGGFTGLRPRQAGGDPSLLATVYDPYDGELLAPYARLRGALAAGDSEALLAEATTGSGYAAFLAADHLWRMDNVAPATRLSAIERMLELRMPDSLKRVETRQLQLARAALAEQAGMDEVALAAFRAALPTDVAMAGLARLERDPYRLASAYQQAGRHEAALTALGALTAPSIEAPSLRAVGRYEAALDAYQRWLAEVPGSQEAALGAAWCLYYLGRDAEAQAAFAAVGSEGTYGRALLANRAGDIDTAVALLADTGRSDLLWLATGILEARDRFTDALPLYLRLGEGTSVYADDSAYRAYVIASRQDDAAVAERAAALLPAGNFFALLLGKEPPAVGVASGAEVVEAPDQAAAPVGAPEAEAVRSPGAIAAAALQLSTALYAINEEDAAVGELLFALREVEAAGGGPEATAAVIELAELLQSMDEYRQSVRAARELMSLGHDDLRVWRLAYPPAWPQVVIPAAESEGIEAALIWAVMRQESAYSPVALSVANAQGLMQVIPSTWDWIAEMRREEPGDPYHVATNIAYGATYLAWLDNYFDGDTELVIASYNGGQGYVRRLFTSDFVAGDKDEFYREIDRSETREYLQRVYENLAVYKALYPSLTEEGADVTALTDAGD